MTGVDSAILAASSAVVVRGSFSFAIAAWISASFALFFADVITTRLRFRPSAVLPYRSMLTRSLDAASFCQYVSIMKYGVNSSPILYPNTLSGVGIAALYFVEGTKMSAWAEADCRHSA